jgi:alkanesulfonate monooxygenase SsuD/methylene tetrahydromethanopterin reductase-like flavin-dependent oxidoreductase (luciferase family)
MQIGVVYPQIELGGDPVAVGRFGRAVEDLGFDHLLAYDHVLGAVHGDRTPALTGPYTEHDPFHDPFVMFAYLSAITERIGFGTGILVLPQRPTVLVPKPTRPIPIWLGGSSEASFDRAARLGDGFIFIGGGTDRTGDSWKRLRDRVLGHGRPVEDFGAEYVSLNRDGAGAVAAEVDAWREAGGTHLAVVTMGLGFASVACHIDYLAGVADALRLS